MPLVDYYVVLYVVLWRPAVDEAARSGDLRRARGDLRSTNRRDRETFAEHAQHF